MHPFLDSLEDHNLIPVIDLQTLLSFVVSCVFRFFDFVCADETLLAPNAPLLDADFAGFDWSCWQGWWWWQG